MVESGVTQRRWKQLNASEYNVTIWKLKDKT